jgi:hypothetical protein
MEFSKGANIKPPRDCHILVEGFLISITEGGESFLKNY